MLTRTMHMRGMLTGLVVAAWLLLWMCLAASCGVGLAMLAVRFAG